MTVLWEFGFPHSRESHISAQVHFLHWDSFTSIIWCWKSFSEIKFNVKTSFNNKLPGQQGGLFYWEQGSQTFYRAWGQAHLSALDQDTEHPAAVLLCNWSLSEMTNSLQATVQNHNKVNSDSREAAVSHTHTHTLCKLCKNTSTIDMP